MMDKNNVSTYGEYHSFLLRLWRVSRENPWRISLTRVGGDEQHTFSRFEDAIAFLDAQIEGERVEKATDANR